MNNRSTITDEERIARKTEVCRLANTLLKDVTLADCVTRKIEQHGRLLFVMLYHTWDRKIPYMVYKLNHNGFLMGEPVSLKFGWVQMERNVDCAQSAIRVRDALLVIKEHMDTYEPDPAALAEAMA